MIALPLLAVAATLTPGDWALYRGSAVVSRHPTEAACVEAAKALNVSRSYTCRTSTGVRVVVTVDPPPPPPPPPPPVEPPAGTGPTIAANPASYAVGGYTTLSWRGTAPCTASAVPAYAPWSGTKQADWSQSFGPNVTTVATITCANGSASVTVEVTGAPPPVDPPPGGGGNPPPPPPPTTLPVPDVLPQPIALPVAQIAANDPARDFAQTALQNWNHGGHAVPVPFTRDQGFWQYEPCTTDYPTWLFDRASAWFQFAELTGDASYRAKGVTETQWYASHINAAGIFDCKQGEADTKYLVVRPFVHYERATGDTSLRPVAARIYAQSAQGFDAAPPSGGGLWTEREVGIHGDAALAYYELTGDTQALARAASLVRHWTAMAGTVGAPLVTYTQHEGGGPGGTSPTSLTNSPWMSALYFQFARNYWQVTGDAEVLRQASAYFDWLDTNGLYDGSLAHPELSGVTVPRYLTGELIGDAGYDYGNINHCPSVYGFAAFAVDAKRRLGLPTARAEQRTAELAACTARTWAYWTRTATQFPRYRIQNPRMWNLWVRGLYEAAR